MKEKNKYSAWWEKSSKIETLFKFLGNPFVVLRQIAVASDFSQAPIGSN